MITGLIAAWREVKLIVIGLVLALFVALKTHRWVLSSIGFGLLSWVVYFFRDPERLPMYTGPEFILSPADGCITDIEIVEEAPLMPGPARRISMFLSIFDVHLQRTPYQGQVQHVQYQSGSFAPAFLKDTHSNEANLISLQTPHGAIVVKQIAGILARRIVCWVAPGDVLTKGQRLGLIKFGSRVDVYLPATVEVMIEKGQQVYGGQTVIAKW